MATKTIYVAAGADLASLIDNVYGELTSTQARGLLNAIDHPEPEACRCGDGSCMLCDDRGQLPGDAMRSARAFLAGIGILVLEGGVSR